MPNTKIDREKLEIVILATGIKDYLVENITNMLIRRQSEWMVEGKEELPKLVDLKCPFNEVEIRQSIVALNAHMRAMEVLTAI